jgi:hypothetical protein
LGKVLDKNGIGIPEPLWFLKFKLLITDFDGNFYINASVGGVLKSKHVGI